MKALLKPCLIVLFLMLIASCKQKETTNTKITKPVATEVESASIEKVNLSCAPKNYNPKILSAPDSMAIHKDWKENQVGTSWSFFGKEKITNEKGTFLMGDLVSPRGEKMQNGPFYVIFSEWSCSK